MMRTDWEKDADWRQIQCDGLVPYGELRRWRRRFWWLVAIDVVLLLPAAIAALAKVTGGKP